MNEDLKGKAVVLDGMTYEIVGPWDILPTYVILERSDSFDAEPIVRAASLIRVTLERQEDSNV